MRFCLRRGRLKLELRVQHLGRDLQIILSGGAAHLGAVALAVPDKASETALFVLPGHREDQLARRMARRMADALKCVVCVSAGIHYDDNVATIKVTVSDDGSGMLKASAVAENLSLIHISEPTRH